MKTLFIMALFDINLRGSIGRGIRLPDDMILTNDRDQVGRLLSANFEGLVGKLEMTALRRSNAVIYCVSDYPDLLSAREDEIQRILRARTLQVNLFLMSTWLHRDNSVNTQLGFLELPHGDPRPTVSRVDPAVRYAKADGSITETEFTDSEARTVRDLYSKLYSELFSLPSVAEGRELGQCVPDQGFVLPEHFNRISRLFHFTQAARATSDLGIKIAGYVTCFEALFCSDSSEMSHKLSERVAYFLGDTPARRLEIFRHVKAAYNIRSKTVHGDTINKKLAERAVSISVTCDDLLRAAWNKILTTSGLMDLFSGSPQALEEYFISLVLGGAGSN